MTLTLFILGWHGLALSIASPALPSPFMIPEGFARLLPSLPRHALTSLLHIAGGYLFALLFGFAGGTLSFLFPVLDRALSPLLDAARSISALALFPAIILLVGIGTESKWLVIFWTSWASLWLTTLHGLKSTDPQLIDAVLLDTANPLRVLFHVRLPLALPVMMTGMRLALSGAWISLVAAEMLGSNAGLGFYIMQSSQTFRFPELYSAVLAVALFNAFSQHILYRLQLYIESRVI